jgi:hypothetical protein
MSEGRIKKILIELQTSSNYERRNLDGTPGTTETIISVPVTTQVNNVNILPIVDDDNNDDTITEDEANEIEEVNVDVNADEDDNAEQNEIVRVEEECFEDLSMRDILGQDPDFFFDSLSRSEIEKRVREIVYPNVKIVVS